MSESTCWLRWRTLRDASSKIDQGVDAYKNYHAGMSNQAIDTVTGLATFGHHNTNCIAFRQCEFQRNLITTVADDPKVLWNATADPIRNDWNTGNKAGAGRAASTSAAAARASTAAAAKGGVTRVYRVEGAGNARLDIDAAGDVSIKGNNMLFLNFGDKARAQGFLAQRLAQGFDDAVIKSFDVPTSYADDVAARAVPEHMAKGASIISVDTTKTAGSYGLRSSEFPALQCAIIPGSGC